MSITPSPFGVPGGAEDVPDHIDPSSPSSGPDGEAEEHNKDASDIRGDEDRTVADEAVDVQSRTIPGAPTTGTWQTNQQIIDSTGAGYRCTAGGSPGTWVPTEAYAAAGAQAGLATTGVWRASDAGAGLGNGYHAAPLGTLLLGLPHFAHENYTIDEIGGYCTGVAGASVRFGLYIVTTASEPFDVLLNGAYATLVPGTDTAMAATASGPVVATFTTAVIIPVGSWFSVGVAYQGTASPSIFVPQPPDTPWGNGGSGPGGSGNAALAVGSVTGALPTTFTPSSFQTIYGAGGWFHRSA